MRFVSLITFCLLVVSCERNTNNGSLDLKARDSVNVNEVDSLAMFPRSNSMTFVATNKKDQIAFLLTRDSSEIFRYRIELLRKWKGLPLDHGVLQLKRIESNGVYVFEGGNSVCTVLVTMHGFGRVDHDYIKIRRNCENDSLDIRVNEFERLTYKG